MCTAFNMFGVSEHFLCSASCAGCSAVRGECGMHGVQIGRLTGSERNLVALCAFSQVIGERVGRRVRGRATHGAPKFSSNISSPGAPPTFSFQQNGFYS